MPSVPSAPCDICCIGHLTADTVITPDNTAHLPGGTAWYFSCALQHLPVRYMLVTVLAEREMQIADALREKGISVKVQTGNHTLEFENRYGDNPDHRVQRVPARADAFTLDSIRHLNADTYHLGPLLADNISPEIIRFLAAKGSLSLDVQGFLRHVENEAIIPADWDDKLDLLPHIHTLKANDHELAVITGQNDIRQGARMLTEWGVKEVVITLGSAGSLIYSDGTFYQIPAYPPQYLKDATGCGDTYMAGYLYKRRTGYGIQAAGKFASAMAGLKLGISGAFEGTEAAVIQYKSSFDH